MKKLLTAVLLTVSLVCSAAEPPEGMRHLVRVGWGDMLFETLAFQPDFDRSRLGYTGHIFAEYQYRFTQVVSFGGQFDAEGIFWTQEDKRVRNSNFIIMPTVRFTWFEREYVSLYSGVGLGLLLSADNAPTVKAAPVFNPNFIGVQAGKGHWSGSFELGGLLSLTGLNTIYLVGSRIFSVSVNFSW